MTHAPVFEPIGPLFALEVCRDLAPDDTMYRYGNLRHYFAVGRSAAMKIATALACRAEYVGGDAPIETVLDYGCGFGRVARYLRAMFPDARIDVTDLKRGGVEWCVQNLRCTDLGGPLPTERYDLIWVGSVFTHLPGKAAARLLSALKSALKPMGILIFTTHGRFSFVHLDAYVHGRTDRTYKNYGLSREAAVRIVEDFVAHGFGFHEYPSFPDYGIAVGTLQWYMDAAGSGKDVVQLHAQERGWDGHQDVLSYLQAPDYFVAQSDILFDPKG